MEISCLKQSLACQITSPFSNELGYFIKLNLIKKTTYLFVEWGSSLTSQ